MNPKLVNFGLPTTGQFSVAVDSLNPVVDAVHVATSGPLHG